VSVESTHRDAAIAAFFEQLTAVIVLVSPLVRQAVREQEALQAAREASMSQSIKDVLKRAHPAKKGAS